MNLFKKNIFLLLIFSALIFSSRSQTQTFPVNGAPNNVHSYYAFKNCTLHIDETVTINNATLLIKDGLIVEAAEKVTIKKPSLINSVAL